MGFFLELNFVDESQKQTVSIRKRRLAANSRRKSIYNFQEKKDNGLFSMSICQVRVTSQVHSGLFNFRELKRSFVAFSSKPTLHWVRCSDAIMALDLWGVPVVLLALHSENELKPLPQIFLFLVETEQKISGLFIEKKGQERGVAMNVLTIEESNVVSSNNLHTRICFTWTVSYGLTDSVAGWKKDAKSFSHLSHCSLQRIVFSLSLRSTEHRSYLRF